MRSTPGRFQTGAAFTWRRASAWTSRAGASEIATVSIQAWATTRHPRHDSRGRKREHVDELGHLRRCCGRRLPRHRRLADARRSGDLLRAGSAGRANLSIGWTLVYDPSGNLSYSESTGLTETARVQLAGGYDGEIVINETLSSRTGQSAELTVNGLHVAVRGGNDFVIASAHADVAGCPQ